MKEQVAYAGFWRRVVAVCIDVLVLMIPQSIFGSMIAMRLASGVDPILHDYAFALIAKYSSILIAWPYFALMESSYHQATLGKKVLGIYVTDTCGNRISFSRASGRFFGRFLSAIILSIGFLMAAFTAKKQALHDILASCLVVRKSESYTASKLHSSISTDDEQFYIIAQNEIETDTKRKGLWLKAYEAHPQDENLQRAAYLHYRVDQLHGEAKSKLPANPFHLKAIDKLKHFNEHPLAGVAVLCVIGVILGVGYWLKVEIKKAKKEYNEATFGGRYDDSWTIIRAPDSGWSADRVHVECIMPMSSSDIEWQTREAFLQSVRKKYPEYISWDDDILYERMVEKYPEYIPLIAENSAFSGEKVTHKNARMVCYKGSTIHIYDDVSKWSVTFDWAGIPDPDRIFIGASQMRIYKAPRKF